MSHDDPAPSDLPADRPRRLQPGNPPGRVQRGPFLVRCPAGRYAHCQCQRSARYPYCDGSHRDLPPGADCKPLKVELESERLVAWCACGRSQHMPFCDGSHGAV